MNLLADESVDQPIVIRLREEGHTVLAIVEMRPGIPDEAVLGTANEQGMVLLTGDKDFGEMVFRDRQYAFGIVLIRLAGLASVAKAEVVAAAVRDHASELAHAFTTISSKNVRIRPRLL